MIVDRRLDFKLGRLDLIILMKFRRYGVGGFFALFGSAGIAKHDFFNTPQQHLNTSKS
jgi:hypothetical protein